MTVSEHVLTAALVSPVAAQLTVLSGSFTLDENWSPYVQGSLVVSLPAAATLAALDPRQRVRLTVTATATFPESSIPGSSRTVSVGLRSRTIDHTAGTVALTFSSDEALLQDYRVTAARQWYGLGVQAAIVDALGQIGATLAGGAPDGQVAGEPLPAPVTNMHKNPAAWSNIAHWTANLGSTGAHTATGPAGMTTPEPHFRWTITQAGQISAFISDNTTMYPAIAGQAYTFSVEITGSTARPVYLRIRWYDSAGATISDTTGATGTTGTPSGGLPRRALMSVSGTAPAGAVKSNLIVTTTGNVAGDVYHLTRAMFTAGSELVEYFDGGRGPVQGLGQVPFSYAWTGTPDNSSSTKTANPYSRTMAYTPGMSLWDYVAPLAPAAGLRLYADEAGIWRLEQARAIKPGQVSLVARNLVDVQDQVTRDGAWHDGAVVVWRWLDDDGIQQTASARYDAPGGGTRTRLVEIDRPYPGAAAAATTARAMTDQATAAGLELTLRGVNNYAAAPGVPVTVTMADGTVQAAYISRAAWSFPDAEMILATRGSTTASPRAWTLQPAGKAWTAVPAGTTWNTYT